jgi:hypothetical protein
MTTGYGHLVLGLGLGAGVELLAELHDVTPCWPRAGPMGGAGLALAAGIWSLM